MDPTIMLPPQPDERWTMAKTLGLQTAVVRFWGVQQWWTAETLQRTKARFEDHGFSLEVIEDRPPMDDVVLGRSGRDEQIETVKALIRRMGRLDIPIYSWVWTERPLGVIRTGDSVPARGDSTTTSFSKTRYERLGRHPAADISEADLWENLEYFLDAIVPVAEQAGVYLALHPDDPPVSPLRGVPRLVTSLERYERILDLYSSPHHGVTFCQGNFAAMGEDIPTAIERLGDNIHFVHFRDVEGTADDFVETWHDDGPTDMNAAIQAYQDIGFDGPIRPDHVPKLGREHDRDEAMSGYTDLGRHFAIGYMKGLLE